MTATIRELLLKLRQTADIAALPILADALLGAGRKSEAEWVLEQRPNEVAVLKRLATSLRYDPDWERVVRDCACRELARLVHARLTAPCGECDGYGRHCSPLMTWIKCAHCVGMGWIVRPALQRRERPK